MSAPNTPTLSIANDGTGTSATATVGSDAGAINQLFYKRQSDALWTAGETITGPGTIQQTGLDADLLYVFQVVSVDPTSGSFSLPSALASVMVMAPATLIKDALGAAVQSLLQSLVPNGGLSLVQRPTTVGMPSSPQNQSCYVLQGDLRPPEDDNMESEGRNMVVTSIQPFELFLTAVQSDAATTPADAVLNAMEQAVVAAILDADGGNYLCGPVPALENVLGAVWFDPSPVYFRNPNNASIFGQIKRLLIEFRHVQNSLFLPTS